MTPSAFQQLHRLLWIACGVLLVVLIQPVLCRELCADGDGTCEPSAGSPEYLDPEEDDEEELRGPWLWDDYEEETQELMERLYEGDITQFLNPTLFEDPEIFKEIGEKLRNGQLVVIRNAFREELAEAMHEDLDTTDNWSHHVTASNDGFHYSHHNVYKYDDYSAFMNATVAMIENRASQEFMTNLSGRNCYGDSKKSFSVGAPSYYMPGDHSLPHTDFVDHRSVAFVWHLSKDWEPAWGGALCKSFS